MSPRARIGLRRRREIGLRPRRRIGLRPRGSIDFPAKGSTVLVCQQGGRIGRPLRGRMGLPPKGRNCLPPMWRIGLPPRGRNCLPPMHLVHVLQNFLSSLFLIDSTVSWTPGSRFKTFITPRKNLNFKWLQEMSDKTRRDRKTLKKSHTTVPLKGKIKTYLWLTTTNTPHL